MILFKMKIFSKLRTKNDVITLTSWGREGYASNHGWDLDFIQRLKGHMPFIAKKNEIATLTFWGREGYESSLEIEILYQEDHRSKHKVDREPAATSINMRSRSCIERITVSSLETLHREGLLKKMWDRDLVSRRSRIFTGDIDLVSRGLSFQT